MLAHLGFIWPHLMHMYNWVNFSLGLACSSWCTSQPMHRSNSWIGVITHAQLYTAHYMVVDYYHFDRSAYCVTLVFHLCLRRISTNLCSTVFLSWKMYFAVLLVCAVNWHTDATLSVVANYIVAFHIVYWHLDIWNIYQRGMEGWVGLSTVSVNNLLKVCLLYTSPSPRD